MARKSLDGPEVFTFSPNRPPKLRCWNCALMAHEMCIAQRCECRTKAHPLRPRKSKRTAR